MTKEETQRQLDRIRQNLARDIERGIRELEAVRDVAGFSIVYFDEPGLTILTLEDLRRSASRLRGGKAYFAKRVP